MEVEVKRELEPRRGCGWRRLRKLYLVGTGIAVVCHRLPLPMPEACPCCGWELKFHRGIQKIDFARIFGECDELEKKHPCHPDCPICNPPEFGWLMWVGEKFYPTPEHFTTEAAKLGVSKAVSKIPKDFVVGEHWVYLAHRKAFPAIVPDSSTLTGYREEMLPGIFYAFRPQRVEMLITESEATEETLNELRERGITPVVVPNYYEKMVEEAEARLKKKPIRKR